MSGLKLPPTALESLFLGLCLLMSVGEILGNSNGFEVVADEGSDVVLPCLTSTKVDLTDKLFDWRKDESQTKKKEVFMYDAGIHYNNGRDGQDLQFKGRVSHYPDQLKNGNASIKIQKVTEADSGNYSCEFPRLHPSQKFNNKLVVKRVLRDRSGEIPGASKPFITTIYGQLQLRCEVQGASSEPKVEWQDSSGNILPTEEPQVSESGGSYNVTLNITVTRTGRYRCVVTQEDIKHQMSAETFVFISGASPKPYITTLDETKDWSLLQCEAEGASPEPKVEWQDSSGNILPAEEPQVSERGGRYYVTLNITVTKTGRYRCVVTQESQIYSETFKFINAASPKPYITTLDETKDWSLLQCEAEGASPEPKVEWQDSSGNILPAEEPQVSERGGRYYVTLKTTVTKTGRYRCVVTQESQIYSETFKFINAASPEPYNTTLNVTKDQLVPQCDVREVSPKPTVVLQNSSGNIRPAEELQVSERGVNQSSVPEKFCEHCSTKVDYGWLFLAFVLGAAVLFAVLFVLRATKRITVGFNRGADPEPTATSADLTKDIPLLQVGVTGDLQNEDGSSKVPPAII